MKMFCCGLLALLGSILTTAQPLDPEAFALSFMHKELNMLGLPSSGIRKQLFTRPQLKIYCLFGNIFSGRTSAMASFTEKAKQEYADDTTVAFAYYSLGPDNKWRMQFFQKIECTCPISENFYLQNLNPDPVPEIVVIEGVGVTGNETNLVYKYDPKSDSLKFLARLSRLTWDGKYLYTYSKGGSAGSENQYSAHIWKGDRLLSQWDYYQNPLGWGYSKINLSYPRQSTWSVANIDSPLNIYSLRKKIEVCVAVKNKVVVTRALVNNDNLYDQKFAISFFRALAHAIFSGRVVSKSTVLENIRVGDYVDVQVDIFPNCQLDEGDDDRPPSIKRRNDGTVVYLVSGIKLQDYRQKHIQNYPDRSSHLTSDCNLRSFLDQLVWTLENHQQEILLNRFLLPVVWHWYFIYFYKDRHRDSKQAFVEYYLKQFVDVGSLRESKVKLNCIERIDLVKIEETHEFYRVSGKIRLTAGLHDFTIELTKENGRWRLFLAVG